jgi:hypothetical protein
LFGAKIGEQEMDFRADLEQLEEWYDLLRNILMDAVKNGIKD